MKKTTLLLSLAFLLQGCNGGGNATQSQQADKEYIRREVSSQIAYIQIDSLLSRYDMFIELSEVLEAKAAKAESEITSKGRSLERSLADAQEKVEKGLVTRAQAAELQEKLQRQERSFYQFRDRVQEELMEENQVMMNNIYNNLTTFLNEFNEDYRYGMILTSTGGAPVLHADPELDITDIVVEALNEAYAKENRKSKKDTKTEAGTETDEE